MRHHRPPLTHTLSRTPCHTHTLSHTHSLTHPLTRTLSRTPSLTHPLSRTLSRYPIRSRAHSFSNVCRSLALATLASSAARRPAPAPQRLRLTHRLQRVTREHVHVLGFLHLEPCTRYVWQGDVQPARRGGRAAREVGASTEETTAASCRALGRSQERQDVNRTTITSMNKPP